MTNRLVQHILEEYPEVTIHNLTDYFLDNEPHQSATELLALTLDDSNVVIIENFNYYKMYLLYSEFMNLKSRKRTLHWHHFIRADMFVMRGSSFVLFDKNTPDDIIRKSTMLAKQQLCASCKHELKAWTPRLRCKNCLIFLCEKCVKERMNDNYWCGCCNNHMIYNKIAKPSDENQLAQLNACISKKLTYDIEHQPDVFHTCLWKFKRLHRA